MIRKRTASCCNPLKECPSELLGCQSNVDLVMVAGGVGEEVTVSLWWVTHSVKNPLLWTKGFILFVILDPDSEKTSMKSLSIYSSKEIIFCKYINHRIDHQESIKSIKLQENNKWEIKYIQYVLRLVRSLWGSCRTDAGSLSFFLLLTLQRACVASQQAWSTDFPARCGVSKGFTSIKPSILSLLKLSMKCKGLKSSKCQK